MHSIFSSRFKNGCLTAFIAILYMIIHASPSFSETYCVGAYYTTQVGGLRMSVSESSDYVYATRTPPSLITPVMVGGGFVWSGEFLDGQFMFRQNLGFEALIASRFDMRRFSFINTFAFVPFRAETFTVWFGPQLNLFYIWGNDKASTLFLYSDYISSNIPFYRKRRYGILPVGTGLALGLDYDVYEYIRMSFEAGFHFSSSVFGQSHEVGNGSASATGYEGYATIAVMYRFMETEKYRHKQYEE